MPRTGLTSEEIRTKAIDATLAKMREVGFEKVRLIDIARELKISHAALYMHFKDKSDLLDAVSERWLQHLDERLEIISEKSKDPCEKIQLWALTLHQTKLEKVRRDPEMYRSFDLAAQELKPFVKLHLENLHRQLLLMVTEAIKKKKLKNANAELMSKIISHACASFHHPRLVANYMDQNREDLLDAVLESIFKGLGLKSKANEKTRAY